MSDRITERVDQLQREIREALASDENESRLDRQIEAQRLEIMDLQRVIESRNAHIDILRDELLMARERLKNSDSALSHLAQDRPAREAEAWGISNRSLGGPQPQRRTYPGDGPNWGVSSVATNEYRAKQAERNAALKRNIDGMAVGQSRLSEYALRAADHFVASGSRTHDGTPVDSGPPNFDREQMHVDAPFDAPRTRDNPLGIALCKTCCFFVAGRCRRYPPVEAEDRPRWPQVSAGFWCGEWKGVPANDLIAAAAATLGEMLQKDVGDMVSIRPTPVSDGYQGPK